MLQLRLCGGEDVAFQVDPVECEVKPGSDGQLRGVTCKHRDLASAFAANEQPGGVVAGDITEVEPVA